MAKRESKVERLMFPEGFRWSAATSAHQIEGGNDNSDWWDFEARPGAIKRGERSGRACDHWNRLEQDIGLLKALGLNHYRFSVEWARIEPVEGQFDQDVLDHYERELTLLREAGIEPLVTLHHFTLPRWVAAEGGWSWPKVAKAFERYSTAVYARLGGLVRDWITINEPMVLIVAGYLSADFPPRIKDPQAIAAPLSGLVRGHARAYHALHAAAKTAGRAVRIGLAHHLRVFDPLRSWHPLDRLASTFIDESFNWMIPRALKTGRLSLRLPFVVSFDEEIPEAAGTEDFVGLNYYSRDLIRFTPATPLRFTRVDLPGQWRTDLGWEIYPEGLYRILKDIAKRYPSMPVMITENGLADAADESRPRFIREHLAWMHRAMMEGVNVESYSHWSLLDNFEWAEGFEPRFGLCHVDYETLARTPRGSALMFAEIARANAMEAPDSLK